PGSSGMIILLGMKFGNPEVTLLAEQVQRITVAAKHKVPQNKQEKKLNQLYLEAAQREINQFREQVIGKDNTKKDKKDKAKSLNITFNQQRESKKQEDQRIKTGLRQLKQRLNSIETNYKYVFQLSRQQTNEHIQKIERVTNRKILEAETAEDKKAYLYKTISSLTETKDAILWKNRDLIKDLEEEYGYATNQALNLDRKDFEAMQERRTNVLRTTKSQKTRPRRQGLELPEILPPKNPYYEEYKPTINEP
ncbi:4979_t:CDS:2, partial [Racocetra persica]